MLILSILLKYISNQPYFKNEAVSVSWDSQLVNVTLKNTELRLFKSRTMVSILLIIYAWIFWFADYPCTFKFTVFHQHAQNNSGTTWWIFMKFDPEELYKTKIFKPFQYPLRSDNCNSHFPRRPTGISACILCITC